MNTLDDGQIEFEEFIPTIPKRSLSWIAVLAIGLLFKVLHWQGATALILFSSGGFFASSVDYMQRYRLKKKATQVPVILGSMWTLMLARGSIFNQGEPYNWHGFIFYAVPGLGFYLIYRAHYLLRKKRGQRKWNEDER